MPGSYGNPERTDHSGVPEKAWQGEVGVEEAALGGSCRQR